VSKGALDLVSGAGSGQISLLRGNGNGTFQSAVRIGGDYFTDGGIGFGDFNADGKLDLVYGWGPSSGDPPAYIKVLLGKGHEKFHGLRRFGKFPDSIPRGIVAGDFNGDGVLDLVVAHEGGTFGGGLFLGKGDGTFKHVWTFRPEGGDAVGGDFNGDGKLDVVLEYAADIYLETGNGDGIFQGPVVIATDGNFTGCGFGPSLFVSDFNNDGNPDLAFCDKVEQIGILLGNGDGTFRGPTYYPTGFGTESVVSFAVGDFNSDGNTDIIASTPGQNNAKFVVFWGKGDGTFQAAKQVSIPSNYGGQIALVPGDFNSDGLLDFVMVNAPGFWVYIQK
jgi:hypothetical protein